MLSLCGLRVTTWVSISRVPAAEMRSAEMEEMDYYRKAVVKDEDNDGDEDEDDDDTEPPSEDDGKIDDKAMEALVKNNFEDAVRRAEGRYVAGVITEQ